MTVNGEIPLTCDPFEQHQTSETPTLLQRVAVIRGSISLFGSKRLQEVERTTRHLH
jgi:hypothetical protein